MHLIRSHTNREYDQVMFSSATVSSVGNCIVWSTLVLSMECSHVLYILVLCHGVCVSRCACVSRCVCVQSLRVSVCCVCTIAILYAYLGSLELSCLIKEFGSNGTRKIC